MNAAQIEMGDEQGQGVAMILQSFAEAHSQARVSAIEQTNGQVCVRT